MESQVQRDRCRVCLKISAPAFKDIFSSDVPVFRILQMATGLNIKKSDGFPSSLCKVCSKELDAVWRFRIKCETSESILLRSEREPERGIKIEINDEPILDGASHRSDDNEEFDQTEQQYTTSDRRQYIWRIKTEKPTVNSSEGGEKSRNYMCAICGKTFVYNGNLLDHERVHSGVKPYECSVCHQKFAQAGHLLVHKRTHSGYKPYQCDICAKFFTVSHSLKKHMRIHSGEKPYSCMVCCKRFSTSYHLSNHSKLHEKIYNRHTPTT